MPTWQLHLRVSAPVPITSRDQLSRELEALNELQRGDPVLVHLEGPVGILSIGVGGPTTVLSHSPISGDPPYHVTRGGAAPGGVVEYNTTPHPRNEGDYTEFGSEQAVDWSVGKQAALDYFDTGRLSSVVAWEEV